MAGNSSGARWRLRPEPELLCRRWGTQLIVFDPFSGNTHLFDRVALVGFDCLRDRLASEQELCQRMAARLEIEDDQTLQRYAGELIALLSKLGLLETVAP